MRRVSAIFGVLGLSWAAGAALAADHTVQVSDNSFAPNSITVSVGDKVVWDFIGSNPHSVSADDGSFDSHPNCSTSASQNCSNVASPNFERVFSTPGTFAYYCRFHGGKGGAGMSGIVTVQSSAPPGTATTVRAASTTAGSAPTASTRLTTTTTTRATTIAAAPAPTIGAETSAVEDTTTSTRPLAGAHADNGDRMPLVLILVGVITVLAAGGYAFSRFYPRPGASGGGIGGPPEPPA